MYSTDSATGTLTLISDNRHGNGPALNSAAWRLLGLGLSPASFRPKEVLVVQGPTNLNPDRNVVGPRGSRTLNMAVRLG
jgi:hypothetical protein